MLDNPVLRLLLERAQAGTRPGERDDGARLVLVAEGGGMRGVVAGGMATALEELGVVEAFDDVYGTSAGALGGAFLLAGQAALGTSLYFDDLTTPEFIAKRRMLMRGTMMSLEFLLDEIMSGRKPLDWQRVVDHPVRLHPIAADLDAGELVDLHAEVCDADRLREALRASARVPGVAGDPVRIGGRRLLDGSVLSPIPFARAIEDGATHLMVLRTRPFGTTLRGPPAVILPPLERWLRRQHPALPELYRARAAAYAAELAELEHAERSAGPPHVLVIAPRPGTPEVRTLEQDRRRLVAGAEAGAQAIYEPLTGERRFFAVALRSYPYPLSEDGRSAPTTAGRRGAAAPR